MNIFEQFEGGFYSTLGFHFIILTRVWYVAKLRKKSVSTVKFQNDDPMVVEWSSLELSWNFVTSIPCFL